MTKNNKEKIKKPFDKTVWFWIIIILIIAIATTGFSMLFSYNVQTFILRIACKPRNISYPDNYDEIETNTSVIRDISYGSKYKNGFLDIISPKESNSNLPLFVYFHGGYYVGGDKESGEPYCRIIANENYIVANVNYILVPDEQYPVQAVQANEAIKFLVENANIYHIDTNNIFIGGDSAGGHLAGQMGAFYTNTQLQNKMGFAPSISSDQLSGVVLLCGYFNMDTIRDTRFPFIAQSLWIVTGEKDFENYERIDELNTIENVTENYPSTFILCGDKDPFITQNIEMEKKLNEKDINYVSYFPVSKDKKLAHEFQREYQKEEAYIARDMLFEFLLHNIE